MVTVNRFLDEEGSDIGKNGWNAEVTINCAKCDEPYVFHAFGLPVGVLPNRPTTSIDGTTLLVPIRPQSADPATGLGMAGLQMRMRMGDPASMN